MATYGIGDIQGCFDSLIRLLDKINFDSHRDTLWFTGDLVNRGPKSLEVLRFIKSLKNTHIVLGNHDLYLLSIVYTGVNLDPENSLQAVLNAPDKEELCAWLRNRSLLHHDSNLGYTLVHAGLPPQWNLNKAIACAQEVETVLRGKQYKDFLKNMYGNEPSQWNDSLVGWERLRFITNCLTRLRFCDIKGNLELTTKGINATSDNYFPWFNLLNRRSRDLNILFGHWAALQGQTNQPNVYALDTGCVWGKCLTAMRLEDKVRISINCLDQR
jgi:bis(5'-nucleosyl)-tetraphosphatase (symmetrical)